MRQMAERFKKFFGMGAAAKNNNAEPANFRAENPTVQARAESSLAGDEPNDDNVNDDTPMLPQEPALTCREKYPRLRKTFMALDITALCTIFFMVAFDHAPFCLIKNGNPTLTADF